MDGRTEGNGGGADHLTRLVEPPTREGRTPAVSENASAVRGLRMTVAQRALVVLWLVTALALSWVIAPSSSGGLGGPAAPWGRAVTDAAGYCGWLGGLFLAGTAVLLAARGARWFGRVPAGRAAWTGWGLLAVSVAVPSIAQLPFVS